MDLPLVHDQEAAPRGRYKIIVRPRDALAVRRDPAPRRGDGDPLVRGRRPATSTTCQRVGGGRRDRHGRLPGQPSPEPRPTVRARWQAARLPARSTPSCTATSSTWTPADHREPLDDANTEFPTIDSRARAARPTPTTCTSPRRDAPVRRAVELRRDDRAADDHWFGDGPLGSEAPFAPRDGHRRGRRLPRHFVYDERDGRRRCRSSTPPTSPPARSRACCCRTGAARLPRHLGAVRPVPHQRRGCTAGALEEFVAAGWCCTTRRLLGRAAALPRRGAAGDATPWWTRPPARSPGHRNRAG